MKELFERGVRLPLFKKPASQRPVTRLTDMNKLSVPLGAADTYRLSVAVGDAVAIGQALCDRPDSTLSPADGVFEGVVSVRHPAFGEMDMAVIGSIRSTTPPVLRPRVSPDRMSPDEWLALIERARVVDELDGVHLAEKLYRLRDVGCQLVIADAVEDEPYASSGWVVLRDHAEDVLHALQWLQAIVGADRCLITLQNKYKYIREMEERCGEEYVYAARRLYPVDRYAPQDTDGLRAARIGVQAVYAAYRAIAEGVPHTETVVTVAGGAVLSPCNLLVPLGTSIEDIGKHVGLSQEPEMLLLGDVMTGLSIDTVELPICVGINCLLFMTEPLPASRQCVGCGRCASVCHQNLLPYEIARELENLHYEQLPPLRADRCDGCGACSFVCSATRDVAASVLRAQGLSGDMVFSFGGEDDE